MFGIGIPELVVILIVGLVIFGPGKLPEVGRAVGKGLREFRKASSALQTALNTPDPPPQPAQTPAPQPAAAPTAPPQSAATPVESQTVNSSAAAQEPVPQPTVPAYEPPTQESVRKQLGLTEQGKEQNEGMK